MRQRNLVHALAAALIAVWFAEPLGGEEPLRIRVLTYNIRHSRGSDGKVNPERIAAAILAAKPDIVALQEVDVRTKRAKNVDQAAEIARLTKMNSVFGKSIDFEGGEFGNAILSRWPIAWSKVQPLPSGEEGSEKRTLLVSDIDLPDRDWNLTFLVTHFDHRPKPKARIRTADGVAEFTALLGEEPAILGADFNVGLDTEPLAKIEKLWTVANAEFVPTTPAQAPDKQWHFVLYRPAERFKVVETAVLDEAVASDHRPVLATLEILPPAKTSR